MDKTRKILLTELIASGCLALLLVGSYETGLLLPGFWATEDNSQLLVLLQFCMQLTTLIAIPLALFLFKIRYVADSLQADESHVDRQLCFWGSVRMMMLCLPMVLNVFFYYAFGDVAGFYYLAIILALSLFFVFPTKKRCEHECHLTNEANDSVDKPEDKKE